MFEVDVSPLEGQKLASASTGRCSQDQEEVQ
jgi:hypothetical protein